MSLLEKLAEKLTPNIICEKIQDIDINKLKDLGIKAFIIDLDNTIIPWKENTVPYESLDWVEYVKSLGIKLFILSNTVNIKRLKRVAGDLKVDFIHPSGKPQKKNFIKIADIFNVNTEEVAVIGDQIFTDVLGGKKAGMFTVLVNPLSKKEFFGTKFISRNFEKLLKKHMKI